MTSRRAVPVLQLPACAAGLACGVDLVDLTLLGRMVEKGGERYLHRLFTQEELRHCQGRVPQLGTRLAAKEAVAKALGTGIRGVNWTDIEVHTAPEGQPCVQLHGPAQARAEQLGLSRWSLSLSHEGEFAVAFVVGTGPQASPL